MGLRRGNLWAGERDMRGSALSLPGSCAMALGSRLALGNSLVLLGSCAVLLGNCAVLLGNCAVQSAQEQDQGTETQEILPQSLSSWSEFQRWHEADMSYQRTRCRCLGRMDAMPTFYRPNNIKGSVTQWVREQVIQHVEGSEYQINGIAKQLSSHIYNNALHFTCSKAFDWADWVVEECGPGIQNPKTMCKNACDLLEHQSVLSLSGRGATEFSLEFRLLEEIKFVKTGLDDFVQRVSERDEPSTYDKIWLRAQRLALIELLDLYRAIRDNRFIQTPSGHFVGPGPMFCDVVQTRTVVSEDCL